MLVFCALGRAFFLSLSPRLTVTERRRRRLFSPELRAAPTSLRPSQLSLHAFPRRVTYAHAHSKLQPPYSPPNPNHRRAPVASTSVAQKLSLSHQTSPTRPTTWRARTGCRSSVRWRMRSLSPWGPPEAPRSEQRRAEQSRGGRNKNRQRGRTITRERGREKEGGAKRKPVPFPFSRLEAALGAGPLGRAA